ncbi:MAG: hypothetical protein A2Z43_04130 [Syntrophobacterales bacterium RBG_19FT_COMBO_59_10]|nr:MAG: hypothetical protein A2Z43_04130 [Syntrophobacterales bacterium RBG_19FT_COMBO_59_10]
MRPSFAWGPVLGGSLRGAGIGAVVLRMGLPPSGRPAKVMGMAKKLDSRPGYNTIRNTVSKCEMTGIWRRGAQRLHELVLNDRKDQWERGDVKAGFQLLEEVLYLRMAGFRSRVGIPAEQGGSGEPIPLTVIH